MKIYPIHILFIVFISSCQLPRDDRLKIVNKSKHTIAYEVEPFDDTLLKNNSDIFFTHSYIDLGNVKREWIFSYVKNNDTSVYTFVGNYDTDTFLFHKDVAYIYVIDSANIGDSLLLSKPENLIRKYKLYRKQLQKNHWTIEVW